MKKSFSYLFAFVLLFIGGFSAQAQYEKGDLLVNPGISFLGYGYGYGYYGGGYSGLPALSASVEYNITDNIAVGGYGGFVSRSYKYSGYKDRWTNIGFGARGIFHATEVLNDALSTGIDSEKWDIYGGLSLGYELYTWSYDDNSIYKGNAYSSGAFVLGGILGTRYMFSPNLGVYGELGRGAFGALTLGVTFKL
jgi:hypothetical protein